jgi:hypothetical protein
MLESRAYQPSVLFAQDITGTWQGTIHTTTDFREVIKISKDGNVLKAMLVGIESQPGLSFPTRPGQGFVSGNPSGQSIKDTISRNRRSISGNVERGWKFDRRRPIAERHDVDP